mgnify:CR=1 FL=1
MQLKIAELSEQNTALHNRLDQTEKENEQLKKRIEVLSALPDQVKGRNLYSIQGIKLTKYTNLYDKDGDGKKEKLIVYLQPIDENGDVIKAPGAVDVELWNLNKPDEQAKLASWRVERDQLKKLWYATFMRINYRLTFDIIDVVRKFDEPLTVKVTFTDYLTGRRFQEQHVIRP